LAAEAVVKVLELVAVVGAMHTASSLLPLEPITLSPLELAVELTTVSLEQVLPSALLLAQQAEPVALPEALLPQAV
jgi:hypothetical protein